MSKRRTQLITKEMLDALNIPQHTTVAVFSQSAKKALFFRHVGTNYRMFHFRDKRAKLILVKTDDMLATLTSDGKLVPGDLFGVFLREDVA